MPGIKNMNLVLFLNLSSNNKPINEITMEIKLHLPILEKVTTTWAQAKTLTGHTIHNFD